MGPSEMEEYIEQRPMPPWRLTLASGDQIVIRDEDEPIVTGITLVLRGEPSKDGRITSRPRFVSIPNIVLAEPLEYRPPPRRRRR